MLEIVLLFLKSDISMARYTKKLKGKTKKIRLKIKIN